MQFFVYALQSASGRIYIGQTCDLAARLEQHNRGKVLSTRAGTPWTLIKSESYPTRAAARYREFCLKRSRGARLRWLGLPNPEVSQ